MVFSITACVLHTYTFNSYMYMYVYIYTLLEEQFTQENSQGEF